MGWILDTLKNPMLALMYTCGFVLVGCHILVRLCTAEQEEKEAIKAKRAREISANRNKFLTENFVSYLKENDLIEDFCEDRDIKFYDFEFAYYELQGYIDEDDIEIFEEE